MSDHLRNQPGPQFPVIHIQQSGSARRTYRVEHSVVVIGQGETGNSIVIRRDPAIAEHHVEIIFELDQVLAVDLGSSSGTYINDERLEPYRPQIWPVEQRLRIGNISLWWERAVLADEGETETPTEESVADPGERQAPAVQDLPAAGTAESAKLPEQNQLRLRPVERQHWFITPGQNIPARYLLSNLTAKTNRFKLTVEGIPSDWYLSSPPVEISPGEKDELLIYLKPPESPHVSPGAHFIQVRAVGEQRVERSDSIRGVVEIQPFSAFRSSLAHAQAAGTDDASEPAAEEVGITIQNLGNVDEQFTVEWRDRTDQLAFSPPAESVELAPNESGIKRSLASLRNPAQLSGSTSFGFEAEVSNRTGHSEVHKSQFVRTATPLSARESSSRSGLGSCLTAAPWSLLLLLLPCLVCGVIPYLYYDGFGRGDVYNQIVEIPGILWERIIRGGVDRPPEQRPDLTTAPENDANAPASTPSPPSAGAATTESEVLTPTFAPLSDAVPADPEVIFPGASGIESGDAAPEVNRPPQSEVEPALTPGAIESVLEELLEASRQLLTRVATLSSSEIDAGDASDTTSAVSSNLEAYETASAEGTQIAVLAATATVIWQDLDEDGDGLVNGDELLYQTAPDDPDTDRDGLNDFDEVQRGTDPRNFDSDGDGATDLTEVQQGTDPLTVDPTPSTQIPVPDSLAANGDEVEQRLRVPAEFHCYVHSRYRYLPLHAGPGSKEDVIAKIPNHTAVYPLVDQPHDFIRDHWVRVQVPALQSCVGWVSRKWLVCSKGSTKRYPGKWKNPGWRW